MTDIDRPLTNDEVITRLTERGIRATCCPECGKVKEVVDDKIVLHSKPTADGTGHPCTGGGLDLLGDVEGAFERLIAHVEEPTTPDDIGEMAVVEAQERLTELLELVEQGGEVTGPSGQPFCGCVPCIVREVTYAVWPYACHAQFTDVVEFLTDKASLADESLPVRKAAQVLAEQIIDRHEAQQESG